MSEKLGESDALTETAEHLWRTQQQVFERNFHRGNGGDWRYGERWEEAKLCLQKFHGLDYAKFRDQRMIDIGSGPRSMCEWFEGATITCIEPLADDYREIGKSRLQHPRIGNVVCAPAERTTPELIGTADYVWSHNCLDHCFSWKSVIENVFHYLKEGGEFYISTDAGKPPTKSHPGIESATALVKCCKDAGLEIDRMHVRQRGEPVWIRTVTLQGRKNSSIRGIDHSVAEIDSYQQAVKADEPESNVSPGYRRRKIEQLRIFNYESLLAIGRHANLAVVGNGPVEEGCLPMINSADLVVRFNDWNRRRTFDRRLAGDRCELLFTQYDATPMIGSPDGFPMPKCVTIAIPYPFHCDRIIECTDRWYSECDVTMVNPYVNRLICEVLGLKSEGWKHPVPTAGFTFLFQLWLMLQDHEEIQNCYVTGFTWHVDQESATVERVPVTGDHMPGHYNHSYLRECKWICRHLFGHPRMQFSPSAHSALSFVSEKSEKGTELVSAPSPPLCAPTSPRKRVLSPFSDGRATIDYRAEDRRYSKLYERGYGSGPVGALLAWATECGVTFQNRTIIDCGCGNAALLSRGIRFARYVGVDLASYQIEKLNRSALASKSVQFIHASIDAIPFADREFDIAWCCDVLEHINPEAVDRVLGELCRVAKLTVLSICTRQSVILDSEGHNLHLTVEGPEWWKRRVSAYGSITHAGSLLADNLTLVVGC